MPLPITPISAPAAAENIARAIQAPHDGHRFGEFQGVLDGAIQSVERPRNEAARAVEGFLAGDGQELHTAILATQRADLAFELGLQVRNKVVSAYQEIMRMQM